MVLPKCSELVYTVVNELLAILYYSTGLKSYLLVTQFPRFKTTHYYVTVRLLHTENKQSNFLENHTEKIESI